MLHKYSHFIRQQQKHCSVCKHQGLKDASKVLAQIPVKYWACLAVFLHLVGLWCCYPVLWALSPGAANRKTAIAAGSSDNCREKSDYFQVHQFEQMHLSSLTLAFLWSISKISYVHLQTLCLRTSSSSHWKVCKTFFKLMW